LPGFTFTPVLAFDNAGVQSLLTSERPDLVGDPYKGICANGFRVGGPSCWFNPKCFSLPRLVILVPRDVTSCAEPPSHNLIWHSKRQIERRYEITLGAEAYNLRNHPNFAVPSNTQSPLTLGGNGDTVFKDAAGNFANNVGRIFSTVGTGVRFNWTHVLLSDQHREESNASFTQTTGIR
jgi:hypothetical protein